MSQNNKSERERGGEVAGKEKVPAQISQSRVLVVLVRYAESLEESTPTVMENTIFFIRTSTFGAEACSFTKSIEHRGTTRHKVTKVCGETAEKFCVHRILLIH